MTDVGRPVVVVSNRGPVSFRPGPHGESVASRGAGGLVSSLGPLLRGTGALWIAAAMTEEDRRVAARGVVEAEGFRLRPLAVDPADYRMAYDVVSNQTLWFTLHGLFDLPRRPRFDRRWREAWDAYRRVNRRFAKAVAEAAPEGAAVLVQDYHLALLGTLLAQWRPDVQAVHFSHVPFCEPDGLRVLPGAVAEELLAGMASHTSCGFHAHRWASSFVACCDELLGARPPTFVAPLGPDPDDLAAVAVSEACAAERGWLEERVGERQLIVRVDRIELSKNLLRGFLAFDDLLRHRPGWRGRVVLGAFVYPSREGLAEYLAYRQEVEAVARRLNETWAQDDWVPVLLDTSDNFARSVAALGRYDVLLVNPVRDGLNLVAKEGPLLNRRDGVLVLSREAGAFEELGGVAIEVNPFDVSETSDALDAALSLSGEQRAARAKALRQRAAARPPRRWLDEQLAQAG